MKLPSPEEATLPIGKIMMGVTAVFAVIIVGMNGYAGQANEKKADAFYATAQDHVRLEEESEALNSINHALDLKEKPEYLEIKANILTNQNKVYEADKVLQKLIVYKPKEAYYRSQLSTMALNEDDLVHAEKWMKEAADLEPNNPEYTVHLANLLYRQNKIDQARALYESVIKKDPNYKFAWDQYAVYFSNGERYPEALAIERRAIQQFPNDFAPYYALANTYDHMKELKKAVVAYRKSLALYPIENSMAAQRIFEITGHHVRQFRKNGHR